MNDTNYTADIDVRPAGRRTTYTVQVYRNGNYIGRLETYSGSVGKQQAAERVAAINEGRHPLVDLLHVEADRIDTLRERALEGAADLAEALR